MQLSYYYLQCTCYLSKKELRWSSSFEAIEQRDWSCDFRSRPSSDVYICKEKLSHFKDWASPLILLTSVSKTLLIACLDIYPF